MVNGQALYTVNVRATAVEAPERRMAAAVKAFIVVSASAGASASARAGVRMS